MVLALCLTLLPAPVRAAEDTPESGAIVQQERQEEISPAVSEQAGTNEEENGSEGDPQNTGTPDAGGAEDSKADAPESGEDENAGNNADAAVSAVQTMIDALPIVSELDGMTADELDAAYDDIQAAYDAYEALNADHRRRLRGAARLVQQPDRAVGGRTVRRAYPLCLRQGQRYNGQRSYP